MVDPYVRTYERVRDMLRKMLHEITWLKANPLGTRQLVETPPHTTPIPAALHPASLAHDP